MSDEEILVELVESAADQLLHYYQLHDWKFEWHCNLKVKRRWGYCNYSQKVIRLDLYRTMNRKWDNIVNTLIHEIAHALCPMCGHNNIWKQKFISMGGTGQRCSSY